MLVESGYRKNTIVCSRNTRPWYCGIAGILVIAFCVTGWCDELAGNPGYSTISIRGMGRNANLETAQRGIDEVVSYYHLRIEMMTSSDYARLLVPDTDKILAVNFVETSGVIKARGITMNAIWIEQEYADAVAHHEISITVDIAISADSAHEKIQFRLEKGNMNESSVCVYINDSNQWILLQEFNYSGAGAVSFFLNTAALQSISPQYHVLMKDPHSRQIFSFYYMWYSSLDIWNSSMLMNHPLLPYISSDESAIVRHIEQAKSAGINGFIASWWGPGTESDKNFAKLLSIAHDKNFRVGIYLEIVNYDEHWNPVSRTQDEIIEWLRYIISRYGKNPAFIAINGKPLIAIYVSRLVPVETWMRIFSAVRNSNMDASYIADFGGTEPQLDCLNAFDGMHTYSIVDLMRTAEEIHHLEHTYMTTARVVRYYPLLTGSLPKIWVTTVQPGFDDHLIPGRRNPVLNRNNGSLYKEVFNSALKSEPDLVFITSWNEWWENTQIEPGVGYGNTYLEITREKVKQWWRGEIMGRFGY